VAGGRLLASTNEAMETKVENPRPATPVRWASLRQLLIGAIIANLLAYPMNAAKDWLIARLCQSYVQQQQPPAPPAPRAASIPECLNRK
jgi:hypothetical protein